MLMISLPVWDSRFASPDISPKRKRLPQMRRSCASCARGIRTSMCITQIKAQMFIFILMRMADGDGGNLLPGQKGQAEGRPTGKSLLV